MTLHSGKLEASSRIRHPVRKEDASTSASQIQYALSDSISGRRGAGASCVFEV